MTRRTYLMFVAPKHATACACGGKGVIERWRETEGRSSTVMIGAWCRRCAGRAGIGALPSSRKPCVMESES